MTANHSTDGDESAVAANSDLTAQRKQPTAARSGREILKGMCHGIPNAPSTPVCSVFQLALGGTCTCRVMDC